MLKWLMLAVYIILSLYLIWRIQHWFGHVIPLFKHKWVASLWISVFIVFASSLFFGVFLPHSPVQAFIHKMSNVWLGTWIYFIFFILIADIIVLILKLINKKKEIPLLKQMRGYLVIGILVVSMSVGLTVYGTVHYKQIHTNSYDVTVEKNVKGFDSLNIVLVADLHMGYTVGCKQIREMVDTINKMDADIIVVAGDIFDNDYDSLDNPDELAAILRTLNSKYGVYAVYGNHDVKETLVGGFPIDSYKYAFRDKRMEEFCEKANFITLTDSVTQILDNQVYLVGRLDYERVGDGTRKRAGIDELCENLDKSKPIIVIDHEPEHLHEIADAGADLILSGHTHAGQFFPLNIVQPIRWENYWGMKKIDNAYSFVTSGIGVYGPAIRVGSDCEIMQINVNFKK